MLYIQVLLLNNYYYTNATTTTTTATATAKSLTETWRRNINDLTNINKAKGKTNLISKVNDTNNKKYGMDSCGKTNKDLIRNNSKKTERLDQTVLNHKITIYNNNNNKDDEQLELPLIENINLKDLELDDDNYFSIDNKDIKFNKSYTPIYTRMENRQCKDNFTIDKDTENTKDDIKLRDTIINSNFLKLYAIENNSIKKQILPEIIIEDDMLQNINSSKIKQLNFDSDIKLAILTKKKIWVDMFSSSSSCNTNRSGNYPWNLEFVRNNDCKTLLQQQQQSTSTLHLKPCGKISKGQNHPDIQYVIKGWCDKKFQ